MTVETQPTRCRECGKPDCDKRWEHERQYGSSEWTWMRTAVESDGVAAEAVAK